MTNATTRSTDMGPPGLAGATLAATPRPLPAWLATLATTGIVGAALLVRQALDAFLVQRTPWVFAVPALILSTLLGGFRQGLLALALLGVGSVTLFFDARHTLRLETPHEILSVALFAGVGVLVCAIVHALRERTASLVRKNAKLEAYESLSDVGTVVLDARDGRILRVNAGFARLTGYREDELLRMTIDDVTHPEDRAGDHAIFASLAHGPRPGWQREKRYVRKDGGVAWVSVNGAPVREARGPSRRTVAVVTDITARKRAERELARSRELLDVVTSTTPALLCYVDKGYRYRFVNAAYETWFGAPPSEFLGRDVRDVLGPELAEPRLPHMRAALRGETVEFEIDTHLRGRAIPTLTTYTPDVDPANGEVRGFVALMQDISELRRAQTEEIRAREERLRGREELAARLREAKDAAERANRQKSEFLANMSHEIRTPLTAIMGFVEVIASGGPDAAARYGDVVRRNSRQLLRIIDDILDLSKVEAGVLRLEIGEVDLQEMLADVRTAHAAAARAKGVSLEVRFQGEAPARMRTDGARLRQILDNAVGNAVKFTDAGSVEVVARHEAPLLAVRVRDTGPGIDAGTAARLFKPFSQGDASATRRYGGTGLGLVLTRRLCQALGGDYLLEGSVPGRGSAFLATVRTDGRVASGTVAVAATVGADAPYVPADEATDEAAGGTRARAALERAVPPEDATPDDPAVVASDAVDVLLVEDSPDNQALMALLLHRLGARVDVAVNGREAVVRALSRHHDLVLMDMQMPVMDGLSATRALRSQGYARPVIALTAHAMSDDRERCLEAGCDAFLSKPVRFGELAALIGRYGRAGTPLH